MKIWKNVVVTIGGFSLVGCTALGASSRIDNYAANTPEISNSDVTRFVTNQNAVLSEFAKMAGVSLPNPNGEWRPIIDAGIHYSDVRCDRFMDSLFWFNRVRETTSRQIQYSGAAVSAALAVMEASVDAIGLTPLGFNFLDQTVNNFGAGLLFNLNPSNVRTIVERKQAAYRDGLSGSYTSRALAMRVIQDYAAICLPPSIETEVELAISTQQYTPKPIAKELPPAADDQTPDAIGLPDRTEAPLAVDVESAWKMLTGMGASTSISIEGGGGAYQIRQNGKDGPWRTDAGSISPNAMYRVRIKSSAKSLDSVQTKLTIGDRSGFFTVTTRDVAAGAGPPAPADADGAPLPAAEPVVTTPEKNAVPNPQPLS